MTWWKECGVIPSILRCRVHRYRIQQKASLQTTNSKTERHITIAAFLASTAIHSRRIEIIWRFNQCLTHVHRERFRTFTRGQVIRPLPGPVGEAAKSPMAHAEVEACGALQHRQRAELSQSSVQQAVGHVLRQHALNVGTVDG